MLAWPNCSETTFKGTPAFERQAPVGATEAVERRGDPTRRARSRKAAVHEGSQLGGILGQSSKRASTGRPRFRSDETIFVGIRVSRTCGSPESLPGMMRRVGRGSNRCGPTISSSPCHTSTRSRPSGIGDPNSSTAGPIATTREVPGFPRCDPYTNACVSVWVSQARYAQIRGDPVPQPDLQVPSCDEAAPDEACSTYPDDQAVELLMFPEDGDAFIAQYGCGQALAEMCRLES